jgi:hypothetical protein
MTTLENTITNEINANGFFNYKRSIIVKSYKLEGWFMDKAQLTFAPSLSELMFDLDALQKNIDYDADVKSSMELKKAWDNFNNDCQIIL